MRASNKGVIRSRRLVSPAQRKDGQCPPPDSRGAYIGWGQCAASPRLFCWPPDVRATIGRSLDAPQRRSRRGIRDLLCVRLCLIRWFAGLFFSRYQCYIPYHTMHAHRSRVFIYFFNHTRNGFHLRAVSGSNGIAARLVRRLSRPLQGCAAISAVMVNNYDLDRPPSLLLSSSSLLLEIFIPKWFANVRLWINLLKIPFKWVESIFTL